MAGSMSEPLDPEDCTTMAEVRAGVDEVDQAIVDLLALRFGYMEAAARIKPSRDTVRDEGRKAQVLANVQGAADDAGIDPALVGSLYEQLIEASIAYELEVFDRTRG